MLNKRMMGIVLGAFVLLQITPEENRGGSNQYPSVAALLADRGGDELRDILLVPASA